MTTLATTDTAPEADWDSAPGLLDGAMELELTADRCDLAYWLGEVAQGTLRGRAITGHLDDVVTGEHMRRTGPLREALLLELASRSVAEDWATRLLSYYVAAAPGVRELEFFATQLLDEARHARVFRGHFANLGIPEPKILAAVEEYSDTYTREVIDPIVDFTLKTIRDEQDFIGGVAIFTIVIEGVLAPAAELSERKWERLDPAASEIARGASIDEIRHLSVGSSLIREHLLAHDEDRARLLEIMRAGRQLWNEVPDRDHVLHREQLFQEGMLEHRDLVADYEIWPGTLMLDTTPESRYDEAERWTDEMAAVRLKYMGFEEALPVIMGETT